jgi:hypothetical protein
VGNAAPGKGAAEFVEAAAIRRSATYRERVGQLRGMADAEPIALVGRVQYVA